MRLIDADKFKQQVAATAIINNLDTKRVNSICKAIDAQPTAYNVECVIREIKDFEDEAEQFGVSGMLADIIEIIETGGAE